MARRVGILVAAIVVLAAVVVWLMMRGPRRFANVYHQRGIITIVAGNGRRGFSGDGGSATKASLSCPEGIALGKDGSIYIADSGNNRIRKVSPNGIITTVAGNGWRAKSRGRWVGYFSGDGGPAVKATLNAPQGVAVGPDGSIYIADTRNNRIRKVDSAGIIRTVVGTGSHSLLPTLDYVDPSTGSLGGHWHFADNNRPATRANLERPVAVSIDHQGQLFIIDQGNLRLCTVNASGIMRSSPTGGEVGRGGVIRAIAEPRGDGGPANRAQFGSPNEIALGRDGSLYICETYNHLIRKINPKGIITTIAGDGWGRVTELKEGTRYEGRYNGDDILATRASLSWPSGVAVSPDGSVYIADMGNSRIRRVDRQGVITTVVGNGRHGGPKDGQVSTAARLWLPTRLAVDPKGDLYISDWGRNQVYKVTWLDGQRR